MAKPALKYRPCVLVVLDGWGNAPDSPGNAIARAKTPNMDRFITQFPSTSLDASSESVGLRWGEMGNSEVGHLNIGAGLVFYQNFPRINKEIRDGSFFENETLVKSVAHVKKQKGNVHLMGIVSSGGVHGHIDHLFALLEFYKRNKIKTVYMHAILDGRDAVYNSGKVFVQSLVQKAAELKIDLQFASLAGRYWAMDRDNRWDRTSKAYNAIINGQSQHMTDDGILDYIEQQYENKEYDEEMAPTVFTRKGKPVATVEDGDVLIFSNFRSDRARQITKAIAVPGFDKVENKKELRDLFFATMVEYEEGLPVEVIYPPIIITHPLARVISDGGYTQLHIAETEKYAHVTFFLNGGAEDPFEGEDRKVIPSPKVSSYDQKPEMKAKEITDHVLRQVQADAYDFYMINFANADMVSHTGNLKASIKACEAVDKQLGRLVEAVLAKNGMVLITADHGNAEELQNLQTGDVDKEHSTNTVPLILLAQDLEGKNLGLPESVGPDLSLIHPTGILADVAPTFLKLSGIEPPEEMTGISLI